MKRTLIAVLAFSMVPQFAYAAPVTLAPVVGGPATAAIATGWWYDKWLQFKKGVEKSYGSGTADSHSDGTPAPGAGNGGATQVPEPAMIVLFGAGAAAIALRRRKRSVPAG